MSTERIKRRLAAILAADMVGYSRMMTADESGTLAALQSCRGTILDPAIAEHGGRTVKLIGDGMLVEFGSAVAAVDCAVAIQRALQSANASRTDTRKIEFRIGINVGEVILDGEDIYGDGVNIAARLEAIAKPGGIVLSEDAWRQVNGRVAAGFADLGEQALKNIARPVRIFRVDAGGAGERQGTPPPPAPTDRPSIAVLPFQNMSGDPEQEYFCDGLVEDIITTLSKLEGLKVIARNSSFVFKNRAVDIREAAQQLGVRYILEGSVRRSGNRVRVTAQLIDARDGAHLWAERYDRAIDDIFAIQDEITLMLATEMQVRLTEGEQARLRYTTTHNVEAWTLWIQGLSHFRQAVTKDKIAAARSCWEKALALDPGSAVLNAMVSFTHCLDARFEWSGDRREALGKARMHADRALNLDPSNADAHIASGVILVVEGRHDDAVAAVRRAMALAPGSADVAEFAGWILALSGFPEDAIVQGRKAMALSPNYPAVYLGNLGQSYRLAGRTDEAIAAFTAYGARSPGFGLVDLVLIYQQIGRSDEARQTARQLLAARPEFTIAGWRRTQLGRDLSRLEADTAALRAVELPEG